MPAATRDRFHREEAASARKLAGVGEQSEECRNGTPGCIGPDAGVGELPCFDCLTAGGESDAA